jgi:sporulation protein YlmC with PRC-barrel domain
MRLKELRGLPVIDPTAAHKVGTVNDYQVDPTSGRVAALDISGVDNGEPERIPGHRIRRVGRHAVILTGRAAATPGLVPDLNDRWLDAGTLVGLEVLGDDGNRIGHLMDGTFNQDSLEIETYLLRATFWEQLFGNRGRIAPTKVHSCSRELMMISTGRMKDLAVAEETQPMAVPLKEEDRLPVPSVTSSARDGQAVGARTE